MSAFWQEYQRAQVRKRSNAGASASSPLRGEHLRGNNKGFSAQEIAAIKAEYGQHGASSRLAQRFGRTRDSIIGKARRLGLSEPTPTKR